MVALPLGPAPAPAAAAASASTSTSSRVSFHAWDTATDWRSGDLADGARITTVDDRPALTLDGAATSGRWTSPPWTPSSPIRDVVASWQATTPGRSWIEVRLRVRVRGHWSRWYSMGSWTRSTTGRRTSVAHQGDADGSVRTDTYVPGVNGLPTAYRLRVVLHGSRAARPQVFQVAAATTSLRSAPARTSATTMRRTVALRVPPYSQQAHVGEFPRYGGGGQVWCSPTSTAMVMSYWRTGPTARELATIGADPVFDAHGRADPEVVWAALHTWDAGHRGTGNWPFNTAYASTYGLSGSVRQYASLRSLERWILHGVPIVASVAWDNTDPRSDNDLDGAPIRRSGGHLLVVSGFTRRGNVIVDDPAAPTRSGVRRVYRRAQFERDWLDASRGTTYVMYPVRSPGT